MFIKNFSTKHISETAAVHEQNVETSLLSSKWFLRVILQIFYDHVDWLTVLWGGLGIVLGAHLGVSISNRISSKVIIQMLSILLIVMGVRLYFG